MQTKYELTKILLELERAGLPEPLFVTYPKDKNDPFIIEWRENKGREVWIQIYPNGFIVCVVENKLSNGYMFNTFDEAVKKLKELLKEQDV